MRDGEQAQTVSANTRTGSCSRVGSNSTPCATPRGPSPACRRQEPRALPASSPADRGRPGTGVERSRLRRWRRRPDQLVGAVDVPGRMIVMVAPSGRWRGVLTTLSVRHPDAQSQETPLVVAPRPPLSPRARRAARRGLRSHENAGVGRARGAEQRPGAPRRGLTAIRRMNATRHGGLLRVWTDTCFSTGRLAAHEPWRASAPVRPSAPARSPRAGRAPGGPLPPTSETDQ